MAKRSISHSNKKIKHLTREAMIKRIIRDMRRTNPVQARRYAKYVKSLNKKFGVGTPLRKQLDALQEGFEDEDRDKDKDRISFISNRIYLAQPSINHHQTIIKKTLNYV